MINSNNNRFKNSNGHNGEDFNDPDWIGAEEKDSKKQLFEYINLIRNNFITVLVIFLTAVAVTVIYLLSAQNIYRARTQVKVEKNEQNILGETAGPDFYQLPTFMANQKQILKSYEIRDRVASALLDSFRTSEKREIFYHIIKKEDDAVMPAPVSHNTLRVRLNGIVNIEQFEDLNILSISAEGPSFDELILITNVYADEYIKYLYEMKMQDLSTLKKFVSLEREKKLEELNKIETELENFKNRHGFFNLEAYSQATIERINESNTQISIAEAELGTIERSISLLKDQLVSFDSTLVDYMQLQLDQASLMEIQKKINILELERELVLAKAENETIAQQIREDFAGKLKVLNDLKEKQSSTVLTNISAETPAEKTESVRRIFDLTLQKIALNSKIDLLKNEIIQSNLILENLPELNIGLAKIKRDLFTNEKLYTLLEEKYQEAEIMERTRIGDAYILDPGNDYSSPVKPNRPLVILIGIFGGLFLSIMFVLVKNYFDRSIKNPESIEDKGIPLLGWVPTIENLKETKSTELEFIVASKPDANASESFKALRTRIQFSKLDNKPIKTILITSSIPGEGKTLVAINLAGSFAQAGKKTLLLDCDLRKPRIHSIFKEDKNPGLTDYLFSAASFNEIIRNADFPNLKFITSGTIPPNPSELLGSQQLKDFLNTLKESFDYIIIDSAPFISVTDSEILYNVTDGTILVAQASITPEDVFMKSFTRMYELNPRNFLGALLNDFTFRKYYGYYYNYYYYYAKKEEGIKK